MSEKIKLKIAGSSTYEPPRVSREALDSGGNYVGPAWPEQKQAPAVSGLGGGIAPQGMTIID